MPVTWPEPGGSPLFEPSNLDWEAYLSWGQPRCYPRGAVVYHANEPVHHLYYLKSGLVRQFFVNSGGVEKVVGLIKAGNIFGEAVFSHGFPALCTNTAAKDSLIYSFSREAIAGLTKINPLILNNLIRSMSLKIRMLTTQINVLTSVDAQAKVERIIYLLVQQSSHGRIDLELTQQDIGELAGVHRVTVSRTLSDLRRRGILEYHRGRLVVRNRSGFDGLAAGASR
ncbi:MAG: Crp/Fnr family transcriptional regulator [Peptococcaceae bacterium]|nr:Crp/Fnr family transcriptional regulator [Peptococcaceae bacterium]